MKYLTILVIAVLLLGAGSAGGYFFFQKQAVASLGEVSAKTLKDKKARDEAALSSAEEVKNLKFVNMTPIILPIIDDSGVSQVVTLIISLEVADKEKEAYVQALIPRLKDAYIQDMYGVLNNKASMEGGLIKVDRLKKRLNRISSNILGEENINGVLLQVVNQRPI